MGCSNSKPNSKAHAPTPTKVTAPTPLTASEILQRLEAPKENQIFNHAGLKFTYAFTSQRGYYPDALDKPNQDSYTTQPVFGTPEKHGNLSFFGVYDGHGKEGHQCAWFIRDKFPKIILDSLAQESGSTKGIKKALVKAHQETNFQLHSSQRIDDALSGTTSITVLIKDRTLFVSNVGDSRAILLSTAAGDETRLTAKPLSSDQTPYRKDERERLKKYGARILSMDQIEGVEPEHENWGDLNLGEDIDEGGDPPRVWSPLGDYPGTAFSRSFGDMIAEELGVVAEPEILTRELTANDRYIVIASDGVFEFLTNQMVAEMVALRVGDPLAACRIIVSAAYEMWLQYEVRTDDITCIIIHINHEGDVGVTAAAANSSGKASELSNRDVKTGGTDGSSSPMQHRKSETDVGVSTAEVELETRPVRRALSREKKKNMIVQAGEADGIEDESFSMESLVVPKSEAEFLAITNALKSNFLFQHLNAAQRASVISVMQPVAVVTGDRVIRQGDRGDKFYVVDTGRYEVRVQPANALTDPTGGEVVHVYESGVDLHPGFGELSLMYGKPRAATVIALTNGKLWALDRRVFRTVVMKSSSANARRDIIRALSKVELLKCLTLQQTQRLADLLNEVSFSAGEYIIRQGEKGDNFYLILSGLCDCTKNGEDGAPEFFLVQRKENEYFGERALLNSEPRAANVKANTDVKLLYIAKTAFDEVLGSLSDIINEDRLKREAMANALLITPKKLAGISLLGVVSSDPVGPLLLGSFGVSPPCLCVRTFLLSAVDSLAMGRAVTSFVEAARVVTASVKVTANPLLPGLHSMSRDTNALHLLFNQPVVADLSSLLRTNTAEGNLQCDHETAVFITASVVSALETLHSLGIVYRAVQPEGVFVDAGGRVMLIDYRVCKVGGVGGRSFTICGASDYLAPEQIAQVGHGAPVDFWELGVLLHELLIGTHPFSLNGEVATYSKIATYGTKTFPELLFADSVPPKTQQFINKLVVATPEARLGAGTGGFAALKKHSFFESVDWSKLATPGTSPLLPLATIELEDLLKEGVDVSVIESFGQPYTGSDWDRDIHN